MTKFAYLVPSLTSLRIIVALSFILQLVYGAIPVMARQYLQRSSARLHKTTLSHIDCDDLPPQCSSFYFASPFYPQSSVPIPLSIQRGPARVPGRWFLPSVLSLALPTTTICKTTVRSIFLASVSAHSSLTRWYPSARSRSLSRLFHHR